MRVVRAAVAALVLALAAAVPAAAAPTEAGEVRVLEVVGAVALDANARASGDAKEQAIAGALFEGVSRVAEDLLVDSLTGDEENPADPVRAALGADMAPYTRSFRIVDDQGERPVLFTEHPDAATEYVVVVEVQVEVDRVRDRLVAAGLLSDEGRRALQSIRVEVRELSRYPGFARLLELLRAPAVGASSVLPLELARGRALLDVQAEFGAEELLSRLLAAAPPELRLTPVGVGAGSGGGTSSGPSLVLSIRYDPPSPPPVDPAGAAASGPGPGASRGD